MVPRYTYIICATPRSGSTLLCEALGSTGLAGKPWQYIKDTLYDHQNYPPDLAGLDDLLGRNTGYSRKDVSSEDRNSCLAQIMEKGTTLNGVLGIKTMWDQLAEFVSILHELTQRDARTMHELLNIDFPNLHYIMLTRRDKVRQAISFWKAIQTQIWSDDGSFRKEKQTSQYDCFFHFDMIERLRQKLIDQEQAWQHYFTANGLQPFQVVYEDLISSYDATVMAIHRYLNISLPEHLVVPAPRVKQQSDEISEQWVERYYSVLKQKNSE